MTRFNLKQLSEWHRSPGARTHQACKLAIYPSLARLLSVLSSQRSI